MTQDRLSIVDIFKIGELFEEISRALSYSINPLHSLQYLIEILKKSEHFKEVVEDLEIDVAMLEKEKDRINPGSDTFHTESIRRIQGHVEEILKDRFDLQEMP